MKKVILAAMAVLTLVGPASATSEWDMFWGTTVKGAFETVGTVLDPKINGWDEFFGTTLDPANTGWNDFWGQCQDENKTVADCVGVIATGVTLGLAAPIIATVGAGAAITAGVAASGVMAVSASVPVTVVTWLPGGGFITSGSILIGSL